jgi:hypothetical protein
MGIPYLYVCLDVGGVVCCFIFQIQIFPARLQLTSTMGLSKLCKFQPRAVWHCPWNNTQHTRVLENKAQLTTVQRTIGCRLSYRSWLYTNWHGSFDDVWKTVKVVESFFSLGFGKQLAPNLYWTDKEKDECQARISNLPLPFIPNKLAAFPSKAHCDCGLVSTTLFT